MSKEAFLAKFEETAGALFGISGYRVDNNIKVLNKPRVIKGSETLTKFMIARLETWSAKYPGYEEEIKAITKIWM